MIVLGENPVEDELLEDLHRDHDKCDIIVLALASKVANLRTYNTSCLANMRYSVGRYMSSFGLRNHHQTGSP